jgi:hypothetical protein
VPRYYFHFTDGKHACCDSTGLDLPDDEAARNEARLEAWDLWNDPCGGCDWRKWTIQVADEKGRNVISLPIDLRWKNKVVFGLERWLTSFRRWSGDI